MMIVIISHKSVTFRFWIFWVSKLFHFLHGVGFGIEKIGFEQSIGFSMMILTMTISHHDDSSFSSDLHSDSLFLHPRVTVTSKPFLYLIINIYCHFCDNHWINCHHSIKCNILMLTKSQRRSLAISLSVHEDDKLLIQSPYDRAYPRSKTPLFNYEDWTNWRENWAQRWRMLPSKLENCCQDCLLKSHRAGGCEILVMPWTQHSKQNLHLPRRKTDNWINQMLQIFVLFINIWFILFYHRAGAAVSPFLLISLTAFQ